MDFLTQSKLSKTEWENIESPVNDQEKRILELIKNGYDNVSIRINNTTTILSFSKMMVQENIHSFLYTTFIEPEITKLFDVLKKIKKPSIIIQTFIENHQKWFVKKQTKKEKPLKKTDIIRLNNVVEIIKKRQLYEFILLEFIRQMLNDSNQHHYVKNLYSIIHIRKQTIEHSNKIMNEWMDLVLLPAFLDNTNISKVFHFADEFTEKNKTILLYEDTTLFAHQKQLFSTFKQSSSPKLVLYTAPTGTGKTLSPIGLSCQYRVIFVCVARHVGLALAKSAISIQKRVAFAFGCETASDIRLHYYAAASYTVNRYTGGIYKVDNSAGQNVEIMICDVQSYLTAMYYMMSFNSEENIITYWDEPTITMDYDNHPLHATIHRNWKENKISKMVLSCATLPREDEIQDSIIDFKTKFEHAEIQTITSFDCKKSVSLIHKSGSIVLPHLLFSNYEELIRSIQYCYENKTVLRYFDLPEVIRLIEYLSKNNFAKEPYTIETYFKKLEEITMERIKILYLEMLLRIEPNEWGIIYSHMTTTVPIKIQFSTTIRKIHSESSEPVVHHHLYGLPIVRSSSVATIPPLPPIQNADTGLSGMLLTTSDAHTLTDGPTIFLVEDVEKIGKFYISQTKIPELTLQEITDKIYENEDIRLKLEKLQRSLEDELGDEIDKTKKMENEVFTKNVQSVMQSIELLYSKIRTISMPPKYIPNTKQHQYLWTPNGVFIENAFIPTIDDDVVKEIMTTDVEQYMKVLLLLGIGVFGKTNTNIKYIEIMKKLANEQKLFIIIAQSDYIYGTNYQFCHGIIGRDLLNMSQQKLIQSIGRIGRNNIQQEYTVRFRDDTLLTKLFCKMEENKEAQNMSILFND